ncbi:hypothetical protein C8Q74DRAFT_1303806 [Fomes fomentarius]|nr:hypothetical protein C8Q74DRAFT_1303806 [Fomes fomentarius]
MSQKDSVIGRDQDHNPKTTASASKHDTPEAALRALHAPELSKEDFARLYKGKLAQIIDLVAENIVGRSETTAARALIQQKREALSQRRPPPDDDTDPLYTAARRAESRLKTARITVDGTQKARDEYMQTVHQLEREKRELQTTLEEKRMTSLLLSILETKEKIRNERFAEIARLFDELRRKTSTESELDRSTIPDLDISSSRRVRAEYTRDTLAAVQAHQLRVSRLASHAKDHTATSSTKAEQRLLDAVARSLNAPTDDPEAIAKFQQLVSAGKSQARLSVQYQSPLHPQVERQEEMHDVSLRIKGKESELQELADHSAALTLACAQSLQTISHFARDTSPALRDGLQQESASAQGHGDVLRLSIVNRAKASVERSQDDGLTGGQSFVGTLESARRAIARAQATESYLREASSLVSSDPSKNHENGALIETYKNREAEVAAKVKRLLDRKGKKTEAGHVLIEDIERLISEVGIIAGSHV